VVSICPGTVTPLAISLLDGVCWGLLLVLANGLAFVFWGLPWFDSRCLDNRVMPWIYEHYASWWHWGLPFAHITKEERARMKCDAGVRREVGRRCFKIERWAYLAFAIVADLAAFFFLAEQ